MKNLKSWFIVTLGCFVLFSCAESEEDKRKKAVEIMSTQTLGLAYLEEFKLEEAEREFLRYIELSPDDKSGYANLGLVYLRMGEYEKADRQLQKAAEMDPGDADIALLRATVFQLQGENDKAILELETALQAAPDHAKVLYDLSELYSTQSGAEFLAKRKDVLVRLVENTEGNVVPNMLLAELYLKSSEPDPALEQMEMITQVFTEFPIESSDYYEQTTALLRKGDAEAALVPFTIFHNYLKVTFPYQSGIKDLKGPGGSVIGFPLITYNEQAALTEAKDSYILDVIRFTDATQSSGLYSLFQQGEATAQKFRFALGDYDQDGDTDIYLGERGEGDGDGALLLNNNLGRFSDVAEEVGIRFAGGHNGAIFSDYDNDGFPDLHLIGKSQMALYYNAGKGQFDRVDVDDWADNLDGFEHAVFADLDHDGDLDLFLAGSQGNLAMRNNGDGSFENLTDKMGLKVGPGSGARSSAFGDFDEDGDLDLLVTKMDGSLVLFANQRQGIFADRTAEFGLADEKNARAIAVGDYNNDGFLDLLVGGNSLRSSRFYSNTGNGRFETDQQSGEGLAALEEAEVSDLTFLDFDNNGFLDVLIGVGGADVTQGALLLYNNGKGAFEDKSDMLSGIEGGVSQVGVFDYNEDGDQDLLLALENGGLRLIRNDGGNMNHFVNMKLVGLRTGSTKNNYFGIGSKVEIRAGDLYQSAVVTEPNVYFGLGNRSKADVIRITWTNGVPQNILLPDADQSLVEEQMLKGSCPFIYAWNGEEFEFVKDITWRSALGMPLGIMGGETQYAFADASDDYIRIAGEQLKQKDGQYLLQLTSELWETIYMDRMELVVVDHPEKVDVYVPEQFSPPPFPGLALHQVSQKISPVSATDASGGDLLQAVLHKDDNYLVNFNRDRFQGTTDLHELILDPGNGFEDQDLKLFLQGWIFPSDASINYGLSQSEGLKVIPPELQVLDPQGVWQTVIPNIGFPMGKDKTVIVDLKDKFLSQDRRVRIRTNMEIYWDRAFFSAGEPAVSIKTTALDPVSADLHYRGFSRGFRKGGRYGPHWFDYAEVSREGKWRDLTGDYTRYGDVLPLLLDADNQYVISNAGDEVSLQFDASSLPALEPGWKRDFFIHSVGWVKDGDMNTAAGNTVAPLPYHGMGSYPPSADEDFPADEHWKRYNEKYNTRKVSNEAFVASIKENAEKNQN